MRLALATLLTLALYLPAPAMTSTEAVDLVVNDLRADLQQSERWREWDREWADYWTVYDLRPYTGFF